MKTDNLPSWIEDDLVKAREMLERFSPKPWPTSSGVDCGVGCQQLFQIGGDYYDFLLHKNETSVFAIGDVSGKGISAALMLANLRAALHDELQRDTINLAGMISKLNRLVYEASPEASYITFFYGQYDEVNSRLHYVNAGHNAPLLFHSLSMSKGPTRLSVGGFPLGMFRDPPESFEQGTESFRPGDILVAYTDGIIEVTDGDNCDWGVEQLINAIQQNKELAAQDLANKVMQLAQTHGSGEANDDMTLIVLKAVRELRKCIPKHF